MERRFRSGADQWVDMHETVGHPEQELDSPVAARIDELSQLSTHLLRLAESERAALAKELHDELGGLITAAKMDMSWLQARLGSSLVSPSWFPGMLRNGTGRCAYAS